MSTMTAETIMKLIEQLPPNEQAKLEQLIVQYRTAKPPLAPKPWPKGGQAALQWVAEHAPAYKGQWVALDGNRLIAASTSHDEVWAAAQADGAYLPLVTFVNDPDKHYIDF
jgi:hypothetical protein